MRSRGPATVAIVDYGMGNLFSVEQACTRAGLAAQITSARDVVLRADAVILPGIGAFGDAMATLRRLDLVDSLIETAASGKPLVGICLGMQLLMDESDEFGPHAGLGLIAGRVVRLEPQRPGGAQIKVPQVCWNRLHRVPGGDAKQWDRALLSGLPDGVFMYFVHSFCVVPRDPTIRVAVTKYGAAEFCSVFRAGNVFGFQGHPERSGPDGLCVYQNLASLLEAGAGCGTAPPEESE